MQAGCTQRQQSVCPQRHTTQPHPRTLDNTKQSHPSMPPSLASLLTRSSSRALPQVPPQTHPHTATAPHQPIHPNASAVAAAAIPGIRRSCIPLSNAMRWYPMQPPPAHRRPPCSPLGPGRPRRSVQRRPRTALLRRRVRLRYRHSSAPRVCRRLQPEAGKAGHRAPRRGSPRLCRNRRYARTSLS